MENQAAASPKPDASLASRLKPGQKARRRVRARVAQKSSPKPEKSILPARVDRSKMPGGHGITVGTHTWITIHRHQFFKLSREP
jgi:hypothetical protein